MVWLKLWTITAALLCAGCLNDTRDETVSFNFDFGSTLAGTFASPPGSLNSHLYSMSGGRAGFEIPFKATRNAEGDTIVPPSFALCRLGTESEGFCPDFVTLFSDSTAAMHAAPDQTAMPWGRSCVLRNIHLQAEVRIHDSTIVLELEASAVYAKRFQPVLIFGSSDAVPPQPDSLSIIRFIVDSAQAVYHGTHVNLNLVEFTGSADVVCLPNF